MALDSRLCAPIMAAPSSPQTKLWWAPSWMLQKSRPQPTHKYFPCGSFNHLVDWCPFPQAALLKTTEPTKKGIWVRHTDKSGPFKSTLPIQTDRWFHNGREGCNNYQQDKCPFPHCKYAHICHSCKQEYPASQCSSGGIVTTTSQYILQIPI